MSKVVTLKTEKDRNRFKKLVASRLNESEQVTVIKLALEVLAERHKPGQLFTCPQDAKDYLRLKLAEREHEVFCCLMLDNKHSVITFRELFTGSINSASVYPREVVKQALSDNAAAVILAHNHPSGIAEPSQSDIHITRRLTQALELVDIRVPDHIVVGHQDAVSFAERGLI